MGYDPKLREEVLALYLEGMSFRGIGKVKKVNHQTVANWINAYHQQLPEIVQDSEATQKVEIDELWTFVGKKRTGRT